MNKEFTFISSVLGAGLLISGIMAHRTVQNQVNQLTSEIDKAKTEIKTKDYGRYICDCEYSTDLARSIKKNNNIIEAKTAEKEFWVKEAQRMNDSLRIDSIAKSAYAKGLNFVKHNTKLVKH